MEERKIQRMAGEAAEIILMTNGLGLDDSSAGRPDTSLALVIERAKAGDSAAFEQIIICYQHRVVSTAWRMLGNREDARDAAQEAFLRAYKYLKSFKQDQDFSGWIYRIVVNVCRDIARKRGMRQQFSSLEEERELGNLDRLRSGDDVEAAAILSQQQALVTRALDTLTKKERAALVLRDLEGLDTKEVARILGSSQTTVRSQISSARAKIKMYRDRVLGSRRQR
jgi:RNA polymerase sigma-70 factor, ECF subfamily